MHDEAFEARLEHDDASANSRRLRVLLPLMIVGHLLHVIVFAASSRGEAAWRHAIIATHTTTGLAAVALYLVTRHVERAPVRAAFTAVVATVYVLHGAAITAADQLCVQSVTPFVGYCAGVAVVFAMRPLVTAGVYAVGLVAFSSGIVLFQTSPAARLAELPNGATMVVAAFAVSLVLRGIRRRELGQRLTIEEQGRELRERVELIERQKELLAHERERSERLLQGEIRHQVAARSRELARTSVDIPPPSPSSPSLGEWIERYRVIDVLGSGGMGVVYEVERGADAKRFALKLMSGRASPDSFARFAREAEIGALAQHPNVVSIVDVGVSKSSPYLVMELVSGGTLEDQRAKFGADFDALTILRDVARGVTELHAAGVVHRDLKPSNVLLDAASSTARVSDFGISQLSNASVDALAGTLPAHARVLTTPGRLLGTPLYMAPEAAHTHALTEAADVFAFGVMAYEMLTGRSPYPVPAVILALAGVSLPVVAPLAAPGLGEHACAILLACIDEDAQKRPTMTTVTRALRSSGHVTRAWSDQRLASGAA